MNLYRVMLDYNETKETGEWFLTNSWERNGCPIDVWSFVTCRPGQRDPAPFLKIRRRGRRTCFDLAGGESVPVATPQIADLLDDLAGGDFERIPAMVEDGTPMEIINVLACVECIDYDKSVIECLGPKDKVRPDLAGEISSAFRLVIDRDRVEEHQIFRLRDWKGPLIIVEPVKQALEGANVSGLIFEPILTECDQPGHLFYWDDDLRRNVEWPREDREVFLKSRGASS